MVGQGEDERRGSGEKVPLRKSAIALALTLIKQRKIVEHRLFSFIRLDVFIDIDIGKHSHVNTIYLFAIYHPILLHLAMKNPSESSLCGKIDR